MKRLNLSVPSLAAAALFAGVVSAADEKEDILARFDRELLAVMSGFAEARESTVSSAFRQEYLGTLDRFVSDANTLQGIVTELDIGEDLNLASHARNIRNSFQAPVRTAENTSNQNDRNRDRNKSGTAKANDPLSRITGKSLSEYTGLGTTGGTGSGSAQNQSSAGFSFHMAGSAIQTLSSLGFGLRSGKYSVSPRYRKILPYLEFKRDVEYFNASYEHFDSLIEIPVWRSDFEKRLKRMSSLAVRIQPVYRAYFPGKTLSAGTEAERLARVYNKFVEYVKAVEQAQQAGNRLNNNAAFDQVRQSSIPDKGLILKDYDTAATHLAEFFSDMDSIDWTVKPFSANGPAAADDSVKRPAKSSD